MSVTEASSKDEKQVRIGEYLVTGKIGQGGIAEIFRGRQESLARDVAIKILSPNLLSDLDIVRRFERESMVIAKLSHPNIVHVIDRGKAGNRYYFVMEFVDGTSLREVIDSARVTLETKLDMLVQVCKALDYAHKNGVIHRDIKPTNILIDKQGNARVADFGIAQIIGMSDTELTGSDIVMGTIAYMSPEQKVSSTNVDQTTDIYAVGIMLYEILTGKRPHGHFKLPSEIDQNLRSFDEIILKTLAQEPRDRYQSAVELKDAILNQIGGGGQSTSEYNLAGAESFMGKCRYLDTIKETKHGSTILVENRANKRLYIIKKHAKGEIGRKEAKLLTSLRHENINPIYGSGGDSRSTVVISEYAQGGSLADRMVRKYEWPEAMKVALQIAAGVNFAHKNNFIHGNIRPSNVLFDSRDTVKLADFGMPGHYDGKKNWYAPPEHKPSKQGDIYAIGVILHQLLLGRTPEYDYVDKLKVDELYRQTPQDIEIMLSRLLAVRVVNRYKSCEEFIADWQALDKRQQAALRQPTAIVTHEPAKKESLPGWIWYAAGATIIAAIATAIVIKLI